MSNFSSNTDDDRIDLAAAIIEARSVIAKYTRPDGTVEDKPSTRLASVLVEYEPALTFAKAVSAELKNTQAALAEARAKLAFAETIRDAAREASARDLELRRSMRTLVTDFITLGPRPDHRYAEPTAADEHAWDVWDTRWEALCARAEVEPPGSLRWIPDHDDPNSVDDLFASGADIHLERMNTCHYWIGITVNGETHHFDLHSKRKIIAFPRQPSPPKETK